MQELALQIPEQACLLLNVASKSQLVQGFLQRNSRKCSVASLRDVVHSSNILEFTNKLYMHTSGPVH